MFRRLFRKVVHVPHYKYETIEIVPTSSYKIISIALDFSVVDKDILNTAINIGTKESEFILIHIIESASALAYGNESSDYESLEDAKTLENYVQQLVKAGYNAKFKIGFGNPRKQIPVIVKEFNSEILVMGSHGHKFFKDIIYGTTISAVRHEVDVPVLIVKKK
jgi:manganese transport protein